MRICAPLNNVRHVQGSHIESRNTKLGSVDLFRFLPWDFRIFELKAQSRISKPLKLIWRKKLRSLPKKLLKWDRRIFHMEEMYKSSMNMFSLFKSCFLNVSFIAFFLNHLWPYVFLWYSQHACATQDANVISCYNGTICIATNEKWVTQNNEKWLRVCVCVRREVFFYPRRELPREVTEGSGTGCPRDGTYTPPPLTHGTCISPSTTQ